MPTIVKHTDTFIIIEERNLANLTSLLAPVNVALSFSCFIHLIHNEIISLINNKMLILMLLLTDFRVGSINTQTFLFNTTLT